MPKALPEITVPIDSAKHPLNEASIVKRCRYKGMDRASSETKAVAERTITWGKPADVLTDNNPTFTMGYGLDILRETSIAESNRTYALFPFRLEYFRASTQSPDLP